MLVKKLKDGIFICNTSVIHVQFHKGKCRKMFCHTRMIIARVSMVSNKYIPDPLGNEWNYILVFFKIR